MSFQVELNLSQVVLVEMAIEGRIEHCEKHLAKCNELGATSAAVEWQERINACLLYTSPSPRDRG